MPSLAVTKATAITKNLRDLAARVRAAEDLTSTVEDSLAQLDLAQEMIKEDMNTVWRVSMHGALGELLSSIVDLAAADPSCLHAADPREDVLYNTADALTAIVEDKDADRREALAKVCLTPLAKLSMNAAVHDAEASEMGIALLVQLFKGSEPSRKALKQIFFQGELAAPRKMLKDTPALLASAKTHATQLHLVSLLHHLGSGASAFRTPLWDAYSHGAPPPKLSDHKLFLARSMQMLASFNSAYRTGIVSVELEEAELLPDRPVEARRPGHVAYAHFQPALLRIDFHKDGDIVDGSSFRYSSLSSARLTRLKQPTCGGGKGDAASGARSSPSMYELVFTTLVDGVARGSLRLTLNEAHLKTLKEQGALTRLPGLAADVAKRAAPVAAAAVPSKRQKSPPPENKDESVARGSGKPAGGGRSEAGGGGKAVAGATSAALKQQMLDAEEARSAAFVAAIAQHQKRNSAQPLAEEAEAMNDEEMDEDRSDFKGGEKGEEGSKVEDDDEDGDDEDGDDEDGDDEDGDDEYVPTAEEAKEAKETAKAATKRAAAAALKQKKQKLRSVKATKAAGAPKPPAAAPLAKGKGPKTAHDIFVEAMRPALSLERPKCSRSELRTLLLQQWKQMDAAERAPWLAKVPVKDKDANDAAAAAKAASKKARMLETAQVVGEADADVETVDETVDETVEAAEAEGGVNDGESEVAAELMDLNAEDEGADVMAQAAATEDEEADEAWDGGGVTEDGEEKEDEADDMLLNGVEGEEDEEGVKGEDGEENEAEAEEADDGLDLKAAIRRLSFSAADRSALKGRGASGGSGPQPSRTSTATLPPALAPPMQPAGRTARFAERQPLGFLRSNSTTAAAHGGSKGGVGGKGYAVAPGPAFFTEHGDAIFIKIGQKMQELQTAMRAARALRVSQLGMASQLQVEELETEAELDLARKAAELEASQAKPAATRTYSALVKSVARLEERALKLQEDRANFKTEARRALEALEATRVASHAALKAEVTSIFRAFEAEMEDVNAKMMKNLKKMEQRIAGFARPMDATGPLGRSVDEYDD
jgi:hypothetical protein